MHSATPALSSVRVSGSGASQLEMSRHSASAALANALISSEQFQSKKFASQGDPSDPFDAAAAASSSYFSPTQFGNRLADAGHR